jgi:subtilase family serine protease
MQRASRILMVLALIGMLTQLPMAGWAADTRMPKAPATVKSPVRVAPAAGTLKSAKPDLVVSKINFSPGKPTASDEITLWVFVKNIGPGQAGVSGVRVKVGGESNPPVIQVPALAPGKEWRYSKKFTLGREGGYIVTATADAANTLPETKEDNNSMQKNIRVAPAPKPDLVVTRINYSPGAPAQHQQVRVWYFVKNIGAGKSNLCYLGTTNSMNNYSIWHKERIPALDPGKEWRHDGYFVSNQAGKYILRAVIDREKVLDEGNEDNNVLERPIVVGPPAN